MNQPAARSRLKSRFTREIELRLPPAMRLATPVIRPMVRKANTQFLANLKRILEA